MYYSSDRKIDAAYTGNRDLKNPVACYRVLAYNVNIQYLLRLSMKCHI
jgi:hypothetical protein